MRILMLALAACGLMLLTRASADEPNKKGENAVAREIELKDFKAERPKGDVAKPTKITSAEELAKAFPDKEWQERIAKQVDFSKEQLLFFAWSGSGQDKLAFKVEEEKKETVVVFTHTPGLTDDLRSHFHLFAIPKNSTWRF